MVAKSILVMTGVMSFGSPPRKSFGKGVSAAALVEVDEDIVSVMVVLRAMIWFSRAWFDVDIGDCMIRICEDLNRALKLILICNRV